MDAYAIIQIEPAPLGLDSRRKAAVFICCDLTHSFAVRAKLWFRAG